MGDCTDDSFDRFPGSNEALGSRLCGSRSRSSLDRRSRFVVSRPSIGTISGGGQSWSVQMRLFGMAFGSRFSFAVEGKQRYENGRSRLWFLSMEKGGWVERWWILFYDYGGVWMWPWHGRVSEVNMWQGTRFQWTVLWVSICCIWGFVLMVLIRCVWETVCMVSIRYVWGPVLIMLKRCVLEPAPLMVKRCVSEVGLCAAIHYVLMPILFSVERCALEFLLSVEIHCVLGLKSDNAKQCVLGITFKKLIIRVHLGIGFGELLTCSWNAICRSVDSPMADEVAKLMSNLKFLEEELLEMENVEVHYKEQHVEIEKWVVAKLFTMRKVEGAAVIMVEIESDNKEVIRIVNGQPPLPMDDAIILLIREMKCRGWTTIFQHIEREANGVADRLAKMMRGETLGGQIFLQPPAVVTELMELEARASVDLLGH
ncbi:hypothetical protein V6N11_018515 [Hibiscus sabdariffa]|uniref:RNase H type-1 domain-containing protein n=1 Tax=Hibiscus sabdariffa TaxID=183260 RepID=A0ABR2T7M1_9ROSI